MQYVIFTQAWCMPHFSFSG